MLRAAGIDTLEQLAQLLLSRLDEQYRPLLEAGSRTARREYDSRRRQILARLEAQGRK